MGAPAAYPGGVPVRPGRRRGGGVAHRTRPILKVRGTGSKYCVLQGSLAHHISSLGIHLLCQESIDEVENLIKKHEAFEKAAATQEERFAALERLTTVRVHMFLRQNLTTVLTRFSALRFSAIRFSVLRFSALAKFCATFLGYIFLCCNALISVHP